jgi:hypothetical protein
LTVFKNLIISLPSLVHLDWESVGESL